MYRLAPLASSRSLAQDDIIWLLDHVLICAISRGASDIHFEPGVRSVRVRFRLNGLLCEQEPLDGSRAATIAVRLKVMFGLDVAQTRLPQDGILQVVVTLGESTRGIDVRLASFPTPYGEKFVLRILDRARVHTHLDALGFDQKIQNALLHIMARSSGFFIVSGPTGSGKTTTLYAMLSHLNDPSKNIVTMEDPIEYHLAGITQSSVNPRAGFTFEVGLRALVRADPDVIMIGEIRDAETARIALQAALTGHFVLSTLHTGTARDAIPRLLDMGVESYLINAALSGVLAQRLIRVLCEDCRVESEQDTRRYRVIFNISAPTSLKRSTGCESCGHTGYGGQSAIGDIFLMNGESGQDTTIENALVSGAHALVCSGKTSLEEYLRFVATF